MSNKFIIRTNLNRAIVLGVVAVLGMIAFYWMKRSIEVLLVLILVVVLFSQYVLSKKLFRIIVDGQKVTFEYLRLQKRAITYDLGLLRTKRHIEVHFRGGKNEIFEIYDRSNGKKIFELSRRSLKKDSDYKLFTDLFNISDG